MQIDITCNVCGVVSTMEVGDGYKYIAKGGCNHKAQIWKKIRDTTRLSILENRIKKTTRDVHKLENLLVELREQENQLQKEIRGEVL